MLAQLIQALYNIIDSLFIGQYSDSGLTALSIVYPIQLLMIAFAVGTGVGINTMIANRLGEGNRRDANAFAGMATPLALVLWAVFAVVCYLVFPAYADLSTDSEPVIQDIVSYGRIVSVFGFGIFLESVWTKVLQAEGDMKTPMIAQVVGAITNILLDPLLIFGGLGLPALGVSGAAVATVIGQLVAAAIVAKKAVRTPPRRAVFLSHAKSIFQSGAPSILMQSAYTFYVFGLNLILAGFCDQAVTALGLYYKWQVFFFIPLGAMQTCIVPIVSFNYAAKNYDRCKKTLTTAILFGIALMTVGTLCFTLLPSYMVSIFTQDALVIEIGRQGFPLVGISFFPLIASLIFPVFFQAVGESLKSSLLTVTRTVVLFVPLGFLFSRFGLAYFWLTFPVTETLTGAVGFLFCRQFFKKLRRSPRSMPKPDCIPVLRPSVPGPIITIARRHGSGGKEIGRRLADALGIPFYYKEMIALAAQEAQLDQAFVSDIHKNAPDILHELYLSSAAVRHAIEAQARILRRIAEAGSCVIVGRSADSVLNEPYTPIKIFVDAPLCYRVARVMRVYGDTERAAKRNIRHADGARAAYYAHISGKRWGDAKNYDLVVDGSCGIDGATECILDHLAQRGIRPSVTAPTAKEI